MFRHVSGCCRWRMISVCPVVNIAGSSQRGMHVQVQYRNKCTSPQFQPVGIIAKHKRYFSLSPASLDDVEICPENSYRMSLDNTILRNHPAYRDLFFQYDSSQLENIVQPIVKDFINIASSLPDAPLYHPKYKSQVDALFKSLKELTELEFQYVLYHMLMFVKPKDNAGKNEFAKVWGPLDDECIRRGIERKKWRAPINFVYADLWACNLLGRRSTYHWILIKTCFRKLDTLSREKFVRLCQSICKSKKLPKDMKLYNLEYNIRRVIEDSDQNGRSITTEELGAICAVFYKLKYPLHDQEVVVNILDICIKNSKTISNWSLAMICNGVCMARRFHIEEKVAELLDAMLPEVPRLKLNACTSLLGLAHRIGVRNLEFMFAVTDRLEEFKSNEKNQEPFEVHHVDWLISAYEDLDYPTSPVFKTIFSIMETLALSHKIKYGSQHNVSVNDDSDDTVPEHQSTMSGSVMVDAEESADELIAKYFHRRLIPILNSLAYGGVYPINLISKALSTEFLTRTYGKSMYTYPAEIVRLDQDVAAELTEYDGPRLSEKALGFLTKSHMTWVPPADKLKIPAYETMCRNISEVVTNIFGDSSCVHLCNLIPHFNTIEVIFCTTKSGNFIPIPNSFKLKKDYFPKNLLPEDGAGELKYHAIITYYWDKLIAGTDEPIGRFSKLKGKIEKMGYKTYEIPHHVWRSKSKEETYTFIRTLLHDVIIKIPEAEVKGIQI